MTKNKISTIPSGVIVPIITPYHYPDIFPLIDQLIDGGVPTIFLFGTTGEALKLTIDLKKTLLKEVKAYIGNRAQLLVGITCPKLEHSVELMSLATEAGACASVLAPLIFEKECAKTVDSLLKKAPGNIFLYNYPAICEGRAIPISYIESVLSEKRIVGIKDSSGDLPYFDKLLNHKRNNGFKVYFGPENNLLEVMEKGCDGFVPGTGNIAPRLACEIWRLREKGPWKEWKDTKEALRKKEPENYISGLKKILFERGVISNVKLWV